MDEIHEWAKRTFLAKRLVTVFGREIIVTGSTTKLTKTGFQQFIDKISEATGIEPPPQDEYVK